MNCTAHLSVRDDSNDVVAKLTIYVGRAFPQSTPYREVQAAAADLVAEFPRYVKAKASALLTYELVEDTYCNYMVPIVVFSARLAEDGVNGGVNETGLRRLAAFRKTLTRLGLKAEVIA